MSAPVDIELSLPWLNYFSIARTEDHSQPATSPCTTQPQPADAFKRSYDASGSHLLALFEMSREADAYRDPLEYREDSPLLGTSDDDDVIPRRRFAPTPPRHRAPATPLPRAQLAAIYTIKLVVPVAGTQILPYVNKMVAGFNLPSERDVGYYTGLMSFGHTVGQFMTIYAWGRLSGVWRSVCCVSWLTVLCT